MIEKPKIVIVDDETDYLNIAAQILEKEGFRVITAECGKEGLEKIAAEKPGLIILDIGLPDMSGIDLKKSLQSNSSLANIPVIFFTVFSDLEYLRGALGESNSKYLIKPFDPDDLISKVKLFLEN